MSKSLPSPEQLHWKRRIMTEEREIVITIRKNPTGYTAAMEFDNEQVYEVESSALDTAVSTITSRIWEPGSIIPTTYK